MPRYYRWIRDCFTPYLSGYAVEIGAGIGTLSQELLPFLDKFDLVESSTNLIPRLSKAMGDDDRVKIFGQDLSEYAGGIPPGTLDGVILVNVLEHIEGDEEALRQIYAMLRPGGYALIFVPAMMFLFSKLDKVHGHYRRYSRRDLRSKVNASGLSIVSLRYFDFLGIAPWWIFNTVGGSTKFYSALTSVYDAIGVPVTRTLESLLSPPIGKNLVLVARRTDS